MNKKQIKKCYYFKKKKNFGDLLNYYLYNKLFEKWRFYNNKKADIYGIGSILQNIVKDGNSLRYKLMSISGKKDLYVISSGFIKAQSFTNEKFSRNIIPLGLRGKLTKARVERNNIDCSNTVLGDFGLIVDYYLDYNRNIQKKYSVGIIPHFVDEDNDFFKRFKNMKDVKILDSKKDPKEFIKDLLECESIISTAMHGLIASDCFKIPNIALKLSDKVIGGSYKFDDYYSVFGMKSNFFYQKDIENISDLKSFVISNYKVKSDDIDRVKSSLRTLFDRIKNKGIENAT